MRKNVKELHKNGWNLYGTDEKMENVLRKHCQNHFDNEVWVVIGMASSISDLEIGITAAFNDAVKNYVFMLLNTDADDNASHELIEDNFPETIDDRDTTSVSYMIESEGCQIAIVCDVSYINWIKKVLRDGYSFTIYRKQKDGTFEIQSVFVVPPKIVKALD